MKSSETVTVRDMEVSNPWAQCIFEGSKKVEVRKDNPDSWESVKTGDVLNIIAKQTQKSQLFKVVGTRVYYTLDECLIAEGVRNLLPGLRSLADGRAVYLGFDGASQEAIKQREEEYDKYGCRAIELAPVVESEECLYCEEVPVDAERAGVICHGCFDSLYGCVPGIVKDEREKLWRDKREAKPVCRVSVDNVVMRDQGIPTMSQQREMLFAHMLGSSTPQGNPDCLHHDGVYNSWIQYNDDTMGGCGSGWEKMCTGCGKVWK
jgi:ASC-1-like (ASCH) protein